MGNRLKMLREDKGISLKKMSGEIEERYKLKISDSQLSFYENGKRSPRDEKVWEVLADYLGVTVTYLRGFTDYPNGIDVNKYIDNKIHSPIAMLYLDEGGGGDAPIDPYELLAILLGAEKLSDTLRNTFIGLSNGDVQKAGKLVNALTSLPKEKAKTIASYLLLNEDSQKILADLADHLLINDVIIKSDTDKK